jgi:hypothetical protein
VGGATELKRTHGFEGELVNIRTLTETSRRMASVPNAPDLR